MKGDSDYTDFWRRPVVWKLSAISSRSRARDRPSHRLVDVKNHLHEHSFHEIGFVVSGCCHWVFRNRKVLMEKGDLIFVPRGVAHREVVLKGESAELAWVGFWYEEEKVPKVPKSILTRPISTHEKGSEVSYLLQQIDREHQLEEMGAVKRVELLIQNLIILLCRYAENRPKKKKSSGKALGARQIRIVRSAANYFRENFADPLSIEQVAAYHSICAPYFSTLFHQYHGVSPQRYLQNARMERVESLVAAGELTLKEIAEECGFVDAAHLCKRFKVAMGVTPKDYRAKRRASRIA